MIIFKILIEKVGRKCHIFEYYGICSETKKVLKKGVKLGVVISSQKMIQVVPWYIRANGN